jgi:hypothetical protein
MTLDFTLIPALAGLQEHRGLRPLVRAGDHGPRIKSWVTTSRTHTIF